MADVPGLDADVYFGDPGKPLTDWRASHAVGEHSHAGDDEEPTPAERAAVIGMLGFDPREFDDAPPRQAPPRRRYERGQHAPLLHRLSHAQPRRILYCKGDGSASCGCDSCQAHATRVNYAASVKLKQTAEGKHVSARSKTGSVECSQAVSAWRTGKANTETHKTLAKCRAMARAKSKAHLLHAAGHEMKAQHIEHIIASGAPVTAKARTEKARGLKAERAAKSKPEAKPESKLNDVQLAEGRGNFTAGGAHWHVVPMKSKGVFSVSRFDPKTKAESHAFLVDRDGHPLIAGDDPSERHPIYRHGLPYHRNANINEAAGAGWNPEYLLGARKLAAERKAESNPAPDSKPSPSPRDRSPEAARKRIAERMEATGKRASEDDEAARRQQTRNAARDTLAGHIADARPGYLGKLRERRQALEAKAQAPASKPEPAPAVPSLKDQAAAHRAGRGGTQALRDELAQQVRDHRNRQRVGGKGRNDKARRVIARQLTTNTRIGDVHARDEQQALDAQARAMERAKATRKAKVTEAQAPEVEPTEARPGANPAATVAAIKRAQVPFAHTRARAAVHAEAQDRREFDAGRRSVAPIGSRDYQSRSQREERPEKAALLRAIRNRFHQTPRAQQAIAEQEARADARGRAKLPLFGGQTPEERPYRGPERPAPKPAVATHTPSGTTAARPEITRYTPEQEAAIARASSQKRLPSLGRVNAVRGNMPVAQAGNSNPNMAIFRAAVESRKSGKTRYVVPTYGGFSVSDTPPIGGEGHYEVTGEGWRKVAPVNPPASTPKVAPFARPGAAR